MKCLLSKYSFLIICFIGLYSCKSNDADKLIGDWKLAYFDIEDSQKDSKEMQHSVKVYEAQLADKYFFFNNGQYGLIDSYQDTLQAKPYTVIDDEIHLEEAISQFSFNNDTLLVREKGKGTVMKLFRYKK